MSQALDRRAGFVIAKTEDGGDTWHPWTVLPREDGKEGALHFFDADTGVLRTINGKLFRTSDGGKTWTGERPGRSVSKRHVFAAPAGPRLRRR